MRKWHFPYILFIFFFLDDFLCYQSVLSCDLLSEHHHLFLYSKTFFFYKYIQSQGWMSYLTAFIIQFFFTYLL